MRPNYLKELLGDRYLEPAQWEAKNKARDEAFKVRLAGLPVAEARAICLHFLADAGQAATSSGRIAAAYLTASNT